MAAIQPTPSSPSGWYQHPTDPNLRSFWDSRKQRWIGSKKAQPGDEERWQQKLDQHDASPGRHQLICPHCQVRGRVTSKRVRAKRGISGGKATGAVLTGGLSMLATGLSRKESVTEMSCGNCGTTWTV